MAVPAIRDHALIGDCHGAALVARDGTVDWGCLRRFDAEPVLASILDEEQGGFLAIRPVAPARIERAYLPRTNLLETRFETETGAVALLDFMPTGRHENASTHD